MRLLGRLFGKGGEENRSVRQERVATLKFSFYVPRKTVRRTAENILVGQGRYRLALRTSGSSAYAPEGRFAPLPGGGWHHAVHMVRCAPVYPLKAGEVEHGERIAHSVFINRQNPGPHSLPSEARNAFRAIPESQLTFVLNTDSRLIFWIEADENRGEGLMELELLKLD